MTFKASKTNSTSSRTSSEIDLFTEMPVPRQIKDKVTDLVGEYLVEKIQQGVGKGISPVSGEGNFKKLSKDYAAFKEQEVGNEDPNLELTGAMLSALDYRATNKGIEIGIFGKEAPKADGHNDFSGDSKIPTRRFLPDEGQSFRSEIDRDIRQIIADAIAEEVQLSPSDFEGVTSKEAFFEVLSQVFDGLSRSEIRSAILGNEELLQVIEDLGLLDYLS